MEWNITFLLLDAMCAYAAMSLYRGAPDFWQRSLLAWAFTAMVVLMIGRIMLIFGDPIGVQIIDIGRHLEHVALLVVIFRLFYVDQERRCLKLSSQHYRNLLR